MILANYSRHTRTHEKNSGHRRSGLYRLTHSSLSTTARLRRDRSRRLSRGHEHNVDPSRFHRLSLLRAEDLTNLLTRERFEAVVHFAAYIAVGESTQKPELYFLNNVSGSISLFTAMERAGINKLVFSSTAAVYGTPERVPILEDFPYAPVSPYGESKVMVEKISRGRPVPRLSNICLRYFNACGSEPGSGLGEEHEPETHLIPLLFRAIETGKPVTLFGEDYPTPDGTCIRDYVHVTDWRSPYLLRRFLLNGGPSAKFNAGTGKGNSVKEVMRAVEDIVGKEDSVHCRTAARRRSSRARSRFDQAANYLGLANGNTPISAISYGRLGNSSRSTRASWIRNNFAPEHVRRRKRDSTPTIAQLPPPLLGRPPQLRPAPIELASTFACATRS